MAVVWFLLKPNQPDFAHDFFKAKRDIQQFVVDPLSGRFVPINALAKRSIGLIIFLEIMQSSTTTPALHSLFQLNQPWLTSVPIVDLPMPNGKANATRAKSGTPLRKLFPLPRGPLCGTKLLPVPNQRTDPKR
jgi:hypothetical protein